MTQLVYVIPPGFRLMAVRYKLRPCFRPRISAHGSPIQAASLFPSPASVPGYRLTAVRYKLRPCFRPRISAHGSPILAASLFPSSCVLVSVPSLFPSLRIPGDLPATSPEPAGGVIIKDVVFEKPIPIVVEDPAS
jgi:hypothetical protein